MRYPGSKNQVFQRLINLIPPHRVYIETHAGSGAVARRKLPATQTILIEIDPEVCRELAAAIAGNGEASGNIAINGGGCPGAIVKSGVHRCASEMARTAGHVGNSDASAAPEMATSPIVAVQPGGLAESGDVPDGPSDRLAGLSDGGYRSSIVNGDAVRFLRSYNFKGDEFVYADPPYVMSSRSTQRAIYRYEYSDQDHVELLACLRALPCPVMLSGYASSLYDELLADWHTHTFEAQTRGGGMATEWLWMNYPTPVALHDYRYLGDNFRERERIKRKKQRWVNRLNRMDVLERRALLAALRDCDIASP